MRKGTQLLILLGSGALAAFALTMDQGAGAADHLDPSPRVGSPVGNAADIADVYAWNTDTLANDGNLVLAMTFAGPIPGTDFTGDRDVLYGIHIDGGDADLEPDATIYARFGQNADGDWGVKFDGIPGTSGSIAGAVGSTIDLGGAKAYAGVRDDPFFFDSEGFGDTLATGDLAFDPTRDFFAGGNVSSIIVEVPLRALPGDGPYNIWGTTGRM